MKIISFSSILLVASCASSRTHSQSHASNQAAHVPPGASKDTASRVFSEVNAYRVACGKKALARHTGLDRLAKQHADYLAKNHSKRKSNSITLNHDGFKQRCASARQSYNFTDMSENIAAFPQPNASQIVTMWKKSGEHDKGMKRNWDLTGVGISVAPDGMVFATQMFANVPPQ